MEIKQFTWDIVDSNSWLIVTEDKEKHATHGLLIDVVDSQPLYDAITALASLTIILTHSHFDHIVGLNHIRSIRPDAVVISTARCSENLGNIHRNLSSTATAFMAFYEQGSKRDVAIEPFTCQPATKTFNTDNNSDFIFDWYGHEIRLLAVYGHSNDGLIAVVDGKDSKDMYDRENSKLLFSGDTLLSIPTVTRFPGGNKKRFWEEDVPLLKQLKLEATMTTINSVF